MEILDGPRLDDRGMVSTVGIRVETPFRGMLAKRDQLLAELDEWLGQHDVSLAAGSRFFLRLHVIDMAGMMDIEVGVTGIEHDGDTRVRPSVLPAGRYVMLTYRDHSLRANKALQAWVAAKGHQLARSTLPKGDLFECRTETFITDPRTEPRKTRWVVELAMLTT